ncbi:MAG: sugar phosphate isomerase/epimerase [Arenicellales bacterium]|nr:sugar phosphate isomerase/epimerase [Arenicellales bacterium]
MNLRDRIGIDVGRKLSVEDAIAWADENDVTYIDCQIDISPNELERFDGNCCDSIREACAKKAIHLGLHTLSAVNIAEISPFVRDAVDQYLKTYIDVAVRLNAEWIVVHAGYHFTDDKVRRMEASLERLKRATDYAEQKGAKLLLENLNWEPDRAEVHYLAHTVEESLYYFDRIDSPALGWSFTINHATLVPEGIDGFLEAMPTNRLDEVRIADNNGEYEIHLYPGDGIIDFADMFSRVEATGFGGHYMNAFGSLDDMLRGREQLVSSYAEAN